MIQQSPIRSRGLIIPRKGKNSCTSLFLSTSACFSHLGGSAREREVWFQIRVCRFYIWNQFQYVSKYLLQESKELHLSCLHVNFPEIANGSLSTDQSTGGWTAGLIQQNTDYIFMLFLVYFYEVLSFCLL